MKLKLYISTFALLTFAALPAFAGTPINKTVAAKADGNVQISNVSGSVRITTWNQDKIHVGGTLGDGAKRLDVEKTSSGVNIRVVLPQNCNCEGSDLVIQLPPASRIKVRTVSANISATGTSGPVALKSISGKIELHSTSADVTAHSVSGNVEISGSAPQARFDIGTTSGKIDVERIHGKLQAESVSGEIEADDSNTITSANFKTTSGDIEFEGALAAGDYAFKSMSGAVKLEFPSVPDAAFRASTMSGDINTNFGAKATHSSKYGPGRTWQYRSGKGSANVTIHTLSGNIHVRVDHD